MRKSRFSEEQIIGVLKAAQAGQKVADLCRKHGICEHTFYRWRAVALALDENGGATITRGWLEGKPTPAATMFSAAV